MLDDTDKKLISTLMEDGRASWVALASEVDLSPPPVTERVRKLEAAGIILGYSARVDPAAVGQRMLAFVSVSLGSTLEHEEFLSSVQAMPEVQECHITAGSYDYLLKVRCEDGKALALLLRDKIRSLPGVSATSSRVALSTIKETSSVPLR